MSGERLTARLRLVPIGPEHAADLVVLHGDPHVAEWYADTWSLPRARTAAAGMRDQWRRDGVGKWIAYDLIDGTLVGRDGVSRTQLDDQDCLELGWAVRDRHRGRGYATEVGRAGLAYAFEVLTADEVVAFTEVHNRASRAVMERLGMRFRREILRPGLVDGRADVQGDAPFALYALAAPTK